MGWHICLSLIWIPFSDEKDSGTHDHDENTIESDNNIENHSSDECDSEESSEEDESSGDDGSLENKTLGNHMASLSDTNKDHRLHDQGQYECLYSWLYFNNALQGYRCKVCELYYSINPRLSDGNQGASSHTDVKFKNHTHVKKVGPTPEFTFGIHW